jgi:cytochrome bd-type quinol oxidase subunit 2
MPVLLDSIRRANLSENYVQHRWNWWLFAGSAAVTLALLLLVAMYVVMSRLDLGAGGLRRPTG